MAVSILRAPRSWIPLALDYAGWDPHAVTAPVHLELGRCPLRHRLS